MTSSHLLVSQVVCGFFWDLPSNPFLFNAEAKFDRVMVCNVQLLYMNCVFKLIFIYALPNHSQKLVFWEELINYVQFLNCPYIILGDFNELSSHNDKVGGVEFTFARLNYMNRLFSSLECIELPFSGQAYTWRKKRSGPNNILERLDKGVANLDWLNQFHSAKVKDHIFTSSDHCHVSLSLLAMH